jgi:hypothetical protein
MKILPSSSSSSLCNFCSCGFELVTALDPSLSQLVPNIKVKKEEEEEEESASFRFPERKNVNTASGCKSE